MSVKISDHNNQVYTIKNDTPAEKQADASSSAVQDYAKALEKKYIYFNRTAFVNGISVSVNASDDFLKKCAENPEEAAAFEKRLDGFPEYISKIKQKYPSNVKAIELKFDENGKPTASIVLSEEDEKKKSDANTTADAKEAEGKVTVAVNAEKRSRQIAAAKNADQINAVLQMLEQDLSECKDGLSKGWCDENEVAKVEALIKRAKEKQAQLPANGSENDENDVNSDLEFMMSSII